MRSSGRSAIVAAALLGCGLLLASCDTGGPPPGVPSVTSGTTLSSPVDSATAPSTTTVSTTPATPISSPTRTVTPSKPAGSSSSATPALDTCTSSTIRVLLGGAEQGQEIAAVTLTNTGGTACTVEGTPAVRLLRGGAFLGAPARPTGTPLPVRLAPGGQAQALITDVTSCQAALSDTVRVTMPASTTAVERPLQLRGCTLSVAPFAPAD